MSMNRETGERVAALLQRLLYAGTWYHSALEIDVHERNENGEDLEKAIRAMLDEILDNGDPVQVSST